MSNDYNYRARIYENYASDFQDAPEKFDEKAAWRWGRLYRHYLKDWLPPDKNATIVDLACGGGEASLSVQTPWIYQADGCGYKSFTGQTRKAGSA